jgi:OPT family small oligopeptide transporter
LKKYKEYSPLFLSTTFALQYGLSFASIMAVVVHTGLFHGKEVWLRFRASRDEPKDIHRKLYEKYPEVPTWWFFAIFLVMIGLGIATCKMYDLQLPIWAYLFGVFMAAFFIVPIGMIYAITVSKSWKIFRIILMHHKNISIGLNVITELIISYLLPGRPMAMMVFKTLGYITMNQGITYAMDQKLAVYMKVPPRTIFWGQFVASIWSCFVQVGVLLWAFGNIPDICTDDQKNHFTCPGGRVFFNASIIWGVIGPQRVSFLILFSLSRTTTLTRIRCFPKKVFTVVSNTSG